MRREYTPDGQLLRFTRHIMECECGFSASATSSDVVTEHIVDHVAVVHKRNKITYAPREFREAGIKMNATGKEPN